MGMGRGVGRGGRGEEGRGVGGVLKHWGFKSEINESA